MVVDLGNKGDLIDKVYVLCRYSFEPASRNEGCLINNIEFFMINLLYLT